MEFSDLKLSTVATAHHFTCYLACGGRTAGTELTRSVTGTLCAFADFVMHLFRRLLLLFNGIFQCFMTFSGKKIIYIIIQSTAQRRPRHRSGRALT